MARNQISFTTLSEDVENYVNQVFIQDYRIGQLQIQMDALTQQLQAEPNVQEQMQLKDQITDLKNQLEAVEVDARRKIHDARANMIKRSHLCQRVDYPLRDMNYMRTTAALTSFRAVDRVWCLAPSARNVGWLVNQGKQLGINIRVGSAQGQEEIGVAAGLPGVAKSESVMKSRGSDLV